MINATEGLEIGPFCLNVFFFSVCLVCDGWLLTQLPHLSLPSFAYLALNPASLGAVSLEAT